MMFNSEPRRARVPLVLTMLAILAASGHSAVAQRAAAPADRFAEIYNRSLLKQQSVRSIRAKFTETTSSTLLVSPLVAHGGVVAAPPARVAMTYTDPERKIVTLDGRTMVVAWPDRHERQEMNITDLQKRIDHYFTTASIKDLRSMFDISARPDAPQSHVDLIEMRATRKQIAQGLERLELWINRDTDMLVRMRLSFPGGDSKTVALENIELNVPVTDAMFKG